MSAQTELKQTNIVLLLLLLATVSPLIGNILLFRLGSFPVTPGIIIFAITSLLFVVARLNRATIGIVTLVAVHLLMWELLRGLVRNVSHDTDWLQSLLLFSYLIVGFILCSRLVLGKENIMLLAKASAFIGLVFGLLGVLQSVLLNLLNTALLIPARWRVTQWDPSQDFARYGGIRQATGLSTEPAIFSTNLALLLALVLVFIQLGYFEKNRRLGWFAVITINAGIFVSFSLTGWLLALVVMIAVFAVGAVKYSRAALLTLVLMTAVTFVLGQPRWIFARVDSVLEGRDRSTRVRVTYSLGLLVSSSTDTVQDLLGSGLGVEEAYRPYIDRIYGPEYGRTDIHNIFAVVRVMQGWLGLALYLFLLTMIIRPLRQLYVLYTPLLLLLIMYHFAGGRYLDVSLWALLALVTNVRRTDLLPTLSRQADAPEFLC